MRDKIRNDGVTCIIDILNQMDNVQFFADQIDKIFAHNLWCCEHGGTGRWGQVSGGRNCVAELRAKLRLEFEFRPPTSRQWHHLVN